MWRINKLFYKVCTENENNSCPSLHFPSVLDYIGQSLTFSTLVQNIHPEVADARVSFFLRATKCLFFFYLSSQNRKIGLFIFSKIKILLDIWIYSIFCIFFGRLKCVGHSFAYVAHFLFLRYVWIRTQRAAVASRCATNLPLRILNIELGLFSLSTGPLVNAASGSSLTFFCARRT